MGVLKQLGLLLKQNLIERKRRWGITLLEIGWPITLFIIIAVVRDLYPIENVPQCKYEPRAMPSSGLFPFMQSYVCNLHAKPSCKGDKAVIEQSRQRASALTQLENTLLDSKELFANLSETLEQSLPALEQLSQVFTEKPEIQKFLNATGNLYARNLFKDPATLKKDLTSTYNMSEELVDTIFNSKINISKAIGLLQDIDSELCDAATHTSPLAKYLVVPAGSAVDLRTINKALCGLDRNAVANLTSLLQQQLDTSSVIALVKKIMSIITPRASDVVSDIERMVDVVSKLSAFRGLAKELPNMEKALRFAMQLLSFVKKVTQSLPVGPEQIGQLLQQIDPLITKWSNNSKIWQDVKRGIFYLNIAVDWVAQTLKKLPDIRISFDQLYTDGGSTILGLLNTTAHDSEYLVDVMGRSTVDIVKMIEWQSFLANPSKLTKETLCKMSKSFFTMFNYPADVDKERLDNAIDRAVALYCKLNPDAFVKDLMRKTNFETLLQQFMEYSNSTVGSRPLDWQSIIEAGWEMYSVIGRLQGYFKQYAPLFDQLINLDLTKLAQAFQNPFAGMKDPSGIQNAIYRSIGNFMDYMEIILRATPVWPYVRSQLVYQNLFAELVTDAIKLSIEATNITDKYLAQDKMEVFVRQFLAMDATVQGSVVKGLTAPKTVRTMLRDPTKFNSALCSNMTGLLGLKVDFTTESELYQLFCKGDFAMPPGLSDQIKAVGDQIQNKVDMLVELFNDPTAYNQNRYDSLAKLSKQLVYQLQINQMSMNAAKNIRMSSPAFVLLSQGKDRSIVPYSILATAMDVLGESLESSSAWTVMAPYMSSIDYTIQFVVSTLEKQKAMLGENRLIGRVLDWILKFGPQKLTLTMEAMKDPMKMSKVMQLLSGGNPMGILKLDCDPDLQEWFYGPGALSSLPMSALKADICRSNMPSIVYAELMDVYDGNTFVAEIRDIFSSPERRKVDWVAMSKTLAYLPRIWNETYQHYTNHFLLYDWSIWEDFVNHTMHGMMNQDSSAQLVVMLPNMLMQMEMSFGNTTEWLIVKHVINIGDVFLVNLGDRFADIAKNGLTLRTLFADATKLSEYIAVQSKLSPAIVDTFFNTLINPTKLASELFTANFTGRMFCKDLFVSQFLEFTDVAQGQLIDKALCGMDWNALLAELSSDKVSSAVTPPIMQLVQGLVHDNLTDISIDYEALSNHTVEAYIAMTSLRGFKGPIFPTIASEFNMTANTFKYKASLERFLRQKPSHWPAILDKVTKQLADKTQLNDIGMVMREVWQQVSLQVQQNIYSIKMVMQQLRSLNNRAIASNGYFSLKDFVLPGQLRNVLKSLDSSPEMTDTLLYSLIQLMNQPQKLAVVELKPEVLDLMCTNLTVFKYFFTLPPESSYSLDQMQTSMCLLRVNISVLLQEMTRDIDGFSQLVKMMQVNGSFPADDLFTQSYNASLMYTNEILRLTSFESKNITLKFNAPRWLDKNLWEHFADRMQNYSQSAMQGLTQTQGYSAMLYGLAPVIDQYISRADVKTRRVFTATGALLEYLAAYFDAYKADGYNNTVFLSGLDKLTTTYHIYRQLPDLLESIVLTALSAPDKLESLIGLLTTEQPGHEQIEIFCSLKDEHWSKYLVKPAGNKLDISRVQALFCTGSLVDDLLSELRTLAGNNPSYFDNIVRVLNETADPGTMSTYRLITLSQRLYTVLDDWVKQENTPTGLEHRLQLSVWRRVVFNINEEFYRKRSQLFDTNLLLATAKYIDLNTLAPEVVPYIHTALAIAKVTLRKLEPLNRTSIDIMDFTRGYPETTKAMQLFNLSSDIVELLMMSGTSVKLRALMQMPTDKMLPTLCTDDWTDYFHLGPRSPVDLDAVKSYICSSVNWTAVYRELISDLEIPYIESELMNNSTLEWSEIFSTVDAITNLVIDVVAAKPKFKYYPWMNETAWTAMINRVGQRLGAQSTSVNFQMQSFFASMVQVAPMLEQLIGNDTGTRRTIYTINVYLQESVEVMEKLSDSGWDLSALFTNTTEMAKLLDLLSELPGYVDIALQTALQPERIAPLIKDFLEGKQSPISVFCGVSDLRQYVVYDNKTDLALLQRTICTGMINFTVVQHELMNLNSDLQMTLAVSDKQLLDEQVVTDLLVSLSQLTTRIMTMVSGDLNALQQSLPRWTQPNAWGNVFQKFSSSLAEVKSVGVLRLVGLLQTIVGDQMFGSLNVSELHVANAVMDVIIRKLELLNRTEVNLTTIFQSSPESVKALDMLQYLPDIVEILISSSRNQKLSSLFTIPDAKTALTKLCTSDANTYLSVPSGSSIDLGNIVDEFCLNNWTAIAQDLMSDVNVEDIAAQINNSSPVNLTLTMARVSRLSELVQYLIANPPRFIVDTRWTWVNATVWQGVLQRMSLQPADAINMITGYLNGVLVPIFGQNPEFNKFGVVLERLLSSVKAELSLWNRPGQNVTVRDILTGNSQLEAYIVKALELSPQMYALLLSTSIKYPGDLQLIFSSPNPQAVLCNENSTFLDLVDMPAEVNITQVKKFICSANFSVILSDLMTRFNVPEIIATLQSNTTATADWSQIQSDIDGIVSVIKQLITQAPNIITPFHVDDFPKIAQRIMSSIDWEGADIYLQMTESMMRYLSAQPFWPEARPYFQISQIIQTWLSDLTSRLKVNPDLSINLADLFPNATLLHEYLKASLSLDDQTVMKLITGISVKPHKLVALFQPTTDNSSAVINLLCDPAMFADFFSVPADTKVTDLSNALCKMASGTSFVDELQKSLNIDTLIQKINQALQKQSNEVYNIRYNYGEQLKFTRWIASLVNVTEVMYDNVNLKDKFAALSNETVFQSYILALTQSLPKLELQLLGDALNGIMPSLRSMEWWNQAEKYFKMMNVMAAVGANRTANLQAVNLTLNTLISNDAAKFRRLLSDSFAFTPELFESIIAAELTISPRDLMEVNTTQDFQNLICAARFPAGVNVTAVRIILCHTDFQLVINQFLHEFGFDIVIEELTRISAYSNVTSDFDWNDLLTNTHHLAQNLGVFFTSLRPPPIPDFFLYKGDMTGWFQRLNKAFASTMNQETAIKRLASALASLEPTLAGYPEYQKVIIVSQVIRNYLDVAISEMNRYTKTVSLEAILRNKTELIALVKASAKAAPEVLELLLTQQMDPTVLTSMLTNPSVNPCVMNLSTLFVKAAPEDVRALRDVFCSINMTALIEEIKREINTTLLMPLNNVDGNAKSVDWSGYMERFGELSRLIEQMVRSPPSISPGLLSLVNVTEYMKMFDRVQKHWLNQSFTLDSKSFAAMMNSLTPILSSSEFGQQLSRFLKVADIIISRLNGKLGDIKDKGVSLDTLLGGAPKLRAYLNTVIKVPAETVATLLMSHLSGDALIMIITNRASELCTLDADKILVLPTGGVADMNQIKGLLCNANISAFIEELSSEYDVSEIIRTLSSNSSAPIDWEKLFRDTKQLSALISHLATNNPAVEQSLRDAFNLDRFKPVFESLKEYDPRSLLRLLDVYGPLVKEASGEMWPLIQQLLYQYSTGFSRTQRMLADLIGSGFTFESLLTNRTALLELYNRMNDGTFDLVQQSYINVSRADMNALLQRDEIQELVCNKTAISVLLPSLPPYVDLKAVLCGVKDESWIREIRSRNYSALEITQLVTAINKWYMEKAKAGVYDWYYISSYRQQANRNRPSANFTLGDLKKPIAELIDVLGNLGTIPPQFFPRFNRSYWMPLIEALTTSYAQNLPIQLLRTLDLLDPLLRDTEFWKEMKTAISAATQYMNWINDKLELLGRQKQTISIVKLFPDINDVKSLLEKALSPKAASEFLAVYFNPSTLISVMQANPSTIFCDPVKFNKSFEFPAGVDIDTIQKELCVASSNDSLVMKQVWELFDMKKLMEELSRLTGDTKKPVPTESPFRAMLKQAQRFLQNANLITRLIQAFNKNMPDISSYVNMLLKTVNTVIDPNANNVGGICDAVVNLVDEVPQYKQAQPYLVRIETIYSIVGHIAASLDNMDDFLCELPSMNSSTLLSKLSNSKLMKIPSLIMRVDDEDHLSTTPFKCSALVRDAMLPQLVIQRFINETISGSFKVCIEKLMTSNITLLQDANTYLGLLGGLRDLLNSEALANLKWLEPLRPLLDELINGILGKMQAGRLSSLVDQLPIADLVGKMFNSSTSTLSADRFFDSLVDVEKLLALLNMTKSDAKNFVCSPKSMQMLFIGSPDYVSNVSQALCVGEEDLSRLLRQMADSLDTVKLAQLAATKDIQGFIQQMVKYIESLMDQFKKMADIPDLLSMASKFDMSAVKELLPKIQKFMSSGTDLDIIVDSLIGILDLLESRVPQLASNTAAANIFNDMRLILNGVRSLRILRNSLKISVPMNKVFPNPDAFKEFLRKSMYMTDEAIADVFNSNFTSNLLSSAMSAMEIHNNLCDGKRLPMLLQLPKTSKLTYAEVSKLLCDIKPDVALNISLVLFKNLQVSNMIANFVSGKFGIDTAELRQVVERMAPIQKDLAVTLTRLTSATDKLNISLPRSAALVSSGSAKAQSLVSMAMVFCGKPISGYEKEIEAVNNLNFGGDDDKDGGDDDEEKFVKPGSPGSTNSQSSGGSDDCDDIRKEVYQTKAGKILWKYLKPLFVGKILYTPENRVTKEIIKATNATFESIVRLFDTVKIIVDSQDKLQRGFNGSNTLSKLQPAPKRMNAQESLAALKDIDPALIRLVLKTDIDIAGMEQQLKLFTAPRNQALLSSLTSAAQYMDCIGLDRFEAVDTEDKLKERAKELNDKGEFIAGIVFMNAEVTSDTRRKRDADVKLPKHVEYKIRMDIDNVETTMLRQDLYYSVAPRDNMLEHKRYLRGFLQIQEMVDRAIVHLHGGDNSISKTATVLHQMPATCYNDDVFMGYVYPYIVPIVMTLSWLFAVAHSIKTLTSYRESGLEELMKIMGLRQGVVWWSWFINTFVGMILLSVIATVFVMVSDVLMLSNGVIVFLYLVTYSLSTTAFCYMVGSFFTKANVASAVGVMAFLICYFPYIIYTQFREFYAVPHFHASSLLSNAAFAIGATYISRWEQMGEGVQWSNIDKVPGYNEGGELTVQWMFFWMLIDSAIYLLIGWYFRNVLPGKFGHSLPLYFPFTKSYWRCGATPGSRRKLKATKKSANDDTDLPEGISIKHLKKVYSNGKVAVNDLNLTFYEGHITAFLGRNGAGKTTTINMLTGLTSPTSGSARVYGSNVDSGIQDIRQNLGFCPQFDMLFDFMTVREHLELFGHLKSSEPSFVVDIAVDDMLRSIGLEHMADELVGTLSGGMQRRLSVAMAFIGNPQVIILDEPTSSIDPHGRRVIWELILKYRAGRTILLCTHHLDEADTLGDRVAIIDEGSLKAEGSPMSLKKQYASGYQLFMEKVPAGQGSVCDVSAVTASIQKFCPSASLMTDVGSSLTYSLPSSESPRFNTLFTKLDSSLQSLGISGYGVSDSTLYEVFEKITENASGDDANSGHTSATVTVNDLDNSFGTSTPSGSCSMLSALYKKRFLHTIKDLKSYISLILLPCAFVALALGATLLVPDRSNQPSLNLQISLYPNTYSFYGHDGKSADTQDLTSTMFTYPGVGTTCMKTSSESSSCDTVEKKLTSGSVLPDPLPVCTCTPTSMQSCEGRDPRLESYVTNTSDKLIRIRSSYDIQDYLLSTQPYYKANRYGGWTFNSYDDNRTTATVWYDNRAFHSSPSYINALSNMILRAAMSSIGQSPVEYGITTYNHPLALTPGPLSIKNALEKTADLGVSIVILVAFSFIPAGLCIYLVLEHMRGEKHLQYISGVGPIRYWLITYSWDMLMFLVPVGLSLSIMYGFEITSFASGDNLLAMFALFVAYAWAVLPMMYMTIKAFKNTTTAFFTLLMTNIFLGIALATIVFLLNFFQLTRHAKYAFVILKNVFLISPQYCLTSALIQLSMNQAYIDILTRFDENISDVYHPFSEKRGIYWNLIALAIQGVVFFIITLLTEVKVSTCIGRASSKKGKYLEADSDVENEKTRVSGQGQHDALITKALSKRYTLNNFRSVQAVKDLTFGVQPGEIFGLCGVNGAGKTSTLKMLTGEILPSGGSATLHGKPITKLSSRRKIGYCPQINALDSLLTGKQTLEVYATLKGVSDSTEAISNIIEAFGMQSYIHKQVKSMSGGMKRHVCVAIALLGNPDLVFLDEPTAGMDPVARRTVWNQILAAAARGCAIILTSHSMAECEALCNRMAIMLNGQLACLGSSQHLKNKFGLGYTLKVKVAGTMPHTTRVTSFVESTWPQAVVKDHHLNTIEFSIPHTGTNTLASLFKSIEEEKDNLYIEEYSVFQTTLDQVFVQFARNQHDQVEGFSDHDTGSSTDTESSSRYTNNTGFVAAPESIVLEADEKKLRTLEVLDGDRVWNTYL